MNRKIKIFTLSVFLFSLLLSFSLTAASRLLNVETVQQNDITLIKLKFDRIPEYSTEIISGKGNLGQDFVDGKAVPSGKDELDKTIIEVQAFNAINFTGKDLYKIEGSAAQSLSLTTENNILKADIELTKYVPNCIEKAGDNTLVLEIYNKSEILKKEITDNVNYFIKHIRLSDGEMTWVYVLEVNVPDNFIFKPVLGNGDKEALATVSEMLWKNKKGIAGVNSCYFGANGLLYSIFQNSDKILSTGPYHRTALGIKNNNEFSINTTDFKSQFFIDGKPEGNIESINRLGGEKIVMFTPAFWSMTTNTKDNFCDIVIENGIIAEINSSGNSKIPENGFVISISKDFQDTINKFKTGEKVNVEYSLGTNFAGYPDVMEVGPRLVEDGKINVTKIEENFKPDIAEGRAPRTAFGFSSDGKTYMIVVDGRRSDSVGMTLEELAEFMLNDLKVSNAMNFDGGGSSEMVIGRSIVNRPTDGHERKVGAALLILEK